METPSSTRRVTRSQTKASATSHHLFSSKKPEDSDNCQSKSIQINAAKPHQERSALFDITNDSPIVGLAMATQTPSSGVVGKRNMSRIKSTPGSGEALLRDQAKTLLQKVEEEADLTKISLESRPFIHLVTSPMGLLAPTPANTPQVLDFSDRVQVVITSPVVAGQLRAATTDFSIQVEESNKFDEKAEVEKSPSITRSLLLDFSDKSEEIYESSESSSVVTQNQEDDNSSVWSMQVNASTKDEEEDEDEVYSYREGAEEEGGFVDSLCEGMRRMSVGGAEFAGKHTRFVYDSEEEKIVEAKEEESPGVLRKEEESFILERVMLGKHVRFGGDE